MRVILIVLDSVGIGALPDAASYGEGDAVSNTLVNIKQKMPQTNLKHLNQLGLCHIEGAQSLGDTTQKATGAYGKMGEMSKGKDTTTGHWEIAGVLVSNPFPTFPNGFPKELINAFEQKIGRKTIGNCVASGTEIIDRLGDLHVQTGFPIVYTSADSVFQIAAHEGVIPIAKQYEINQMARDLLTGLWNVARVIARPFEGESGHYKRTKNRHDFSLAPIGKTMLDCIQENHLEVAAVGKIHDIFAGRGTTKTVSTANNQEGIDKTLVFMNEVKDGLIFTNLVDFDMQFGHRNDVEGYANALMEFDVRLPEILDKLQDDDLLIITADHGCDPTVVGTDHTREYVPLILAGKTINPNTNLGVLPTFADVGKTVLDYLGIEGDIFGTSFLKKVIKHDSWGQFE